MSLVNETATPSYGYCYNYGCNTEDESASLSFRDVAHKYVVPLLLPMALLVGTGGQSDFSYARHRGDCGYSMVGVRARDEGCHTGPRTAATDLKRIKEVFRPSVSELAALFRVTRQTIYNWMGGEQPKPEHANRLANLAKAADTLDAEGLSTSPRLLRRKLPSGKTLVEMAQAGETIDHAAGELIAMLRREAEQRRTINQRLAGRTKKPLDLAEFGLPMLNEKS